MIAKPNTAACVAFFWLFSCSSSLAQSWDNEVGDADWFSQTNWDTDILPDGTQDVFIDTSGETVLITDQDPDATAQARDMFLGSTAGANGELTITSGGLAQSTGNISVAHGANSTGTLVVTGSGSMLTAEDSLFVGSFGNGTMRVENGGAVTAENTTYVGYVADSEGQLTVTGSGSTLSSPTGEFIVGYAGTGTLTIEDGGMATSSTASIGSTPGSIGTVRVTGENSQWYNATQFYVGNTGTGTLSVEDGGTVVNDSGAFVGYYAGSTGAIEVTGNESSLMASSLAVGWAGSGSLAVSDGAAVVAGGVHLAFEPGTQGSATVTGSGSSLTADTIYVVKDGSGVLTVEDGGTVDAVENFYVGTILASGQGYVRVTSTGSTLKSREISIEAAGKATLVVEDGGLLEVDAGNGSVFIAPNTGTVGSLVIGADPNLPGYDPLTDLTAPGTVSAAEVSFGDGDLYGDGAGLLIFNHTDETGAYEFAPAVVSGDTGTGTIEHLAGHTNLTGDGSGFTGETHVEGGTLAVTGGGMLGGSAGYVGYAPGSDGAAIVSGAGSNWTTTVELGVGFEGTGSLVIEDGGTVDTNNLYLGYPNATSGSIVVTGSASALTANGFYMAEGSLLVEDGGVVRIDNGGDETIINTTVTGNGIGSNSDILVRGSGSILDAQGQFYFGTVGMANLTVADGGLLVVSDQDSSDGVKGDGTINLGFQSSGTGYLNIGAAAGEAPDAPGTVSAADIAFGPGTGKLVFNHTDESGDYEFAPNIASDTPGTATIEHHAGFTRLTGDGSDYVQTTDIHGGTLAIDNVLGGQVNVLGGGTLGGSGLANGDVSFNSGSYYLVEMDGTTGTQGLTVEGTAALTGGTVMIEGEYTAIAGAGPIVIMTTDTALATTFDGAVTPSVFYTPTLSYEMDGGTDYVFVSIEQDVLFSDLADTQNRRSVAGALDGLPGGHPLASALLLLGTEEAARDAYDQLSGEAHASLKGALVENGQQAVRAVNDRIHAAFEADANTSVSAYGDTADPANGFWMTGYGDWMTTDATGNTAEMSNNLYGVIAGIDRRFGDYGRLGILGGYSRTNTSIDALASEADADSYTVGVYGGADNGNTAISLGALYTWHSIESTRIVTNPVSETLAADYDARSFQLFAEAGYKATMDRVTLEPFAGVSYINLNTDAFSETGGMAALSSSSDTTSTTFTTLGLRSSIELASNVSTRGMVGWRHAFGDVDPASTFTIGGSGPFSILGAPIAQDAAVVEAGIDIAAGENVTIGASYEGQYGDGAIANGFNARLLAEF